MQAVVILELNAAASSGQKPTMSHLEISDASKKNP
jgi:hypothetical protein